MAFQTSNPFDSIESAQDYLGLLAEEVARVLEEVEAEREFVSGQGVDRHLDALHLVCYKLQRLQQHVRTSRRILNDLRLLRRLFENNSDRIPPAKENRNAVTEYGEPLGC